FAFLADDAIFFGSRLSKQIKDFVTSKLLHYRNEKCEPLRHQLLKALENLEHQLSKGTPEFVAELDQKLDNSFKFMSRMDGKHRNLGNATNVILTLKEIEGFVSLDSNHTLRASSQYSSDNLANLSGLLFSFFATPGRSFVFQYILNEVFS